MSSDCISVSDAIWDFVRDGIELTDEVLHHARFCRSCAGTLAEARAGVAALSCVKPYPAAPDCRQWVMSRVSGTRRVSSFRRLLWAAVPAAAAVGLLLVLYHEHPRQTVRRPTMALQSGSPQLRKQADHVDVSAGHVRKPLVTPSVAGARPQLAGRPVQTQVVLAPPTMESGLEKADAMKGPSQSRADGEDQLSASPAVPGEPVAGAEFRAGSPGCSPLTGLEQPGRKLADESVKGLNEQQTTFEQTRQSNVGMPDTKAAPTRGIAVLASSIGSDVSPQGLAEFVQQGKFSPVVVDWAWITFHWGRTDFAAMNRFLELMAARKVPVAAMYRPRFLSNPTVATQVGKDGKPGTDHAEICYSDPSARKWGISWGEKILEKCPSFREIIIYNPLNQCQCPKCTAASANGPHPAIMGFLSEARTAWRTKQPDVKLGVVSMPYPDFWKASLAVVDVSHPYLCIKEDIDPAKEVANIQAVRPIIKEKMGSCLGKITWEEGAKVSIEKLKTVDSLARNAGISYFFWTYETLFKSSLYDPKAVVQALAIGRSAAGEAAGGRPAQTPQSTRQPGDASNAPDDTKRKWAEALLAQVQNAEHGAAQFAAIDALAQKVKESDAVGRSAILSLAISTMNDKSRAVEDRWPCCYVVSRSGDEQGVPDLIQALLHDESDTMRLVAAEALGQLPNNTAAHDALLQASRKETNQSVREVLARYLGQAMPALEPSASPPAPTSAGGVEELAPSGPPQPPPGPPRPVAKPLPWPFPGDYKEQSIFNNYQTATDEYIHCGLDFLHPAGTPVTAVGPGYVAAIWSNPPHTHDFFIVTPARGGNRGWCYTHLDPQTFMFKEGDFIQQGQVLGKLVKFSPDEKNSMDHLDLTYVTFTWYAPGKLNPNVHSLLDPLYFFDWKDTEPPAFLPLRLMSEGSVRQFQADAAGVVKVNGKVDILAAITDSAYPRQESFLGVPVVMLSISDGTHTMQKLVLDHRGDVGDKKQTKPLYLPRDETKKLFNTNVFPYYQGLWVTKTDGDGKITPKDATECWDTTARDSSGKPVWPDGQYSVNVYAWDIAGNRGVVGAAVQVRNKLGEAAGSAPAQVAQSDDQPSNSAQTLDETRRKAAETLLERMVNPQQYDITALDALVQTAKESDAATRRSIISSVVGVMNDKNRAEYPRWLCCKVLSGIGDERAVPDLIQVLLRDGSEIVRSVAAAELGEFYKKSKSTAARDGLLQSARKETSPRVREELARLLGQEMPGSLASPRQQVVSKPGDSVYTPDEIRRTVETFLERMLQPDQFVAMNALAQKAKESDAVTRRSILSLVIAAMQDKGRPVYQRWQCCYVLSGCGDEQAVPDLIQVLLHDESDTVRGVAAEALADFPKSAAARDSLLQAARQETSPSVREVLTRRLGKAMPALEPSSAPAAAVAVDERAPSGPPLPPPGPPSPVAKPLPWPFTGGQEDQHIFNNYQQATDIYIHCGLDFILPAGTPVAAVGPGYVAAIFTNYPDWITHYFFIVTPKKGGDRGWCYTHLDPRTFTFKEGDFIRQGQRLGSLVDFSVGNQPGVAHLHLHYVAFTRDASGKVKVHSLLDPLYFFEWKDTVPPTFQPLRLVSEGTAQQFQADAASVVTVSGKVDILAAITDSAFPGHMGNLGVPVVMLSISDGAHTMQKLVLDHRGDVGDEKQTKPLYLSYEEKKALFNPDSFPRYQVLRVTKTDDDGKIMPEDATECWDTTVRDGTGRPVWPDGQYSVNVYAWDIAGNRAVVGATVQVKNAH